MGKFEDELPMEKEDIEKMFNGNRKSEEERGMVSLVRETLGRFGSSGCGY